MPSTEVLPDDPHYFLLCAVVTVAMQLSCFAIAYSCKFDKITDFAGSTNFIVLAILTLLLGGHFHVRQLATTLLLTISRLELALFFLYRVLKWKKDVRFDKVREKFWPFLIFWIFQMFWVYGVTLPVFRLNATAADPAIGAWDVAGWIVWAIGFFMQVLADMQKLRFRANPANAASAVCDNGVWSLSRHPNYCGEIFIWIGIFLTTVPVWQVDGESAGWLTIISPFWTAAILLGLSGMPTAEGASLRRFYENGEEHKFKYEAYRERTPPILPCFCPGAYQSMPRLAKQVFCCEWPCYEYPGGEVDSSGFFQAASSRNE